MTRLYFYVEGETEQAFVKDVLKEHLANHGVWVEGWILAASGQHHRKVHRGGGQSYSAMKRDLVRQLRNLSQPDVRLTTMFDLYSIYADFPDRVAAEKLRYAPRDRVLRLEKSFGDDVGDHRFIPHIQLYEFETMLLCETNLVGAYFDAKEREVANFVADIGDQPPESINDGLSTAPSKRIIRAFPGYLGDKATSGPAIAAAIGLPAIRAKCPHFHDWVTTLEQLGAA